MSPISFHSATGTPELITYPPQERVEQHGDILLGRIGKVDLNDIGHLVSIAVDKVGLERAQVGGQEGRDILLDLGALNLLSALPLGRRG